MEKEKYFQIGDWKSGGLEYHSGAIAPYISLHPRVYYGLVKIETDKQFISL
jgi:hypothetical protein